MARYFTDLVSYGSNVHYIYGDLLTSDLSHEKYDNLLSLLVILHISEKRKAFQIIAGLVKENGKIFIEDFYEKSPLTAKERHISVHGKQLVTELNVFYNTIVKLFGDGHLGGVRLLATMAHKQPIDLSYRFSP